MVATKLTEEKLLAETLCFPLYNEEIELAKEGAV